MKGDRTTAFLDDASVPWRVLDDGRWVLKLSDF